MTCQKYTRAYLHGIVTSGMASAAILMTYHNVAYMQRLTHQMKESIKVGFCMSSGVFYLCRALVKDWRLCFCALWSANLALLILFKIFNLLLYFLSMYLSVIVHVSTHQTKKNCLQDQRFPDFVRNFIKTMFPEVGKHLQ